MATIPLPKELGRLILDIFKQKNLRAGERIPYQMIRSVWSENGHRRDDDLRSGIDWLKDEGFLEEERQFLFLTEKGFAEM